MYVDRYEENQVRYRGYNPEFYRRVMAKRKAQEREAEMIAQKRKKTAALEAKRKEMADKISEQKAAEIERAEARKREMEAFKLSIRAQREEREEAERIARNLRRSMDILTCKEIELRACKVFGVMPSEIWAPGRNEHIVFIRQFIIYWTMRRTKLSLAKIGKAFGGRDHTTILHGAKAYREKRARMGRSIRVAREKKNV